MNKTITINFNAEEEKRYLLTISDHEHLNIPIHQIYIDPLMEPCKIPEFKSTKPCDHAIVGEKGREFVQLATGAGKTASITKWLQMCGRGARVYHVHENLIQLDTDFNVMNSPKRYETKSFVDLKNHQLPKSIQDHMLDAQKYQLDLIANMYKIPKGILHRDGRFEFLNHNNPEFQSLERMFRGDFRSIGNPDDGSRSFIRKEDVFYGVDWGHTDDFEKNRVTVRLAMPNVLLDECHKWQWNPLGEFHTKEDQSFINNHIQKHRNKMKTIKLEDVILTDEEKTKIADELRMDDSARQVASSITRNYFACIPYEEKQRLVKMLVLQLDAEYELEKKKVADQIANLENVLIEKKSKRSLADEFLK